jgi:hypothetical protein
MIAIDTYTQPMTGFEDTCHAHLTTFLTSDGDENLYNFFKDCVNQNLIKNLFLWVPYELPVMLNWGLIRYYSDDLSTATLVKEKFEDMNANFSVKKFWNQMNFEFACVDPKEIVFDEEPSDSFFPVIDLDGNGIWAFDFPVVDDLTLQGWQPAMESRRSFFQNLSNQKNKYFANYFEK